MDISPLFESSIFTWVILPLFIFMARVTDVSLGTIRIIYISRGMKLLAPLFGFFEIMIWLVAITLIVQNLNNTIYFLAYGLGFATGNFVGIKIEERLAVGRVVIHVITQMDASQLIENLRKCGYGVTTANAEGSTGPVKLIFTIVDRKEMEKAVNLIRQFNPKAFFSVEDVRIAKEGIFPPSSNSMSKFLKLGRKGK